MLGEAGKHLRTDLIFIMKGEDDIRPTGTGEDLVRAGLTFDTPADAKKRRENTLRLATTDSCRSKRDGDKFGSTVTILEPICHNSQS